MVNNSIKFNNKNNHFSTQIIEHTKIADGNQFGSWLVTNTNIWWG